MQRAFAFLPLGSQPVYDKPEGTVCFVVGEEGQNILALKHSWRVLVPTWPLRALTEIPPSMTGPMLQSTAAILCQGIALSLTHRIEAVVSAAEEAGADETYTALVLVRREPYVFFRDTRGVLKLIIEAEFGVCALYDATDRVKVGQLPLELASVKDFEVPLSDWRTLEGRTLYANRLQDACRRYWLGIS